MDPCGLSFEQGQRDRRFKLPITVATLTLCACRCARYLSEHLDLAERPYSPKLTSHSVSVEVDRKIRNLSVRVKGKNRARGEDHLLVAGRMDVRDRWGDVWTCLEPWLFLRSGHLCLDRD